MHVGVSSPTLGVIGGGQLGRMLAEAAGPLGVDLIVSDPTPKCPASAVARDQIVGDFDDVDTIRSVADRSDFLTFEIELVDPDALETVMEETGIPVHPAPESLRMTQDKLVEKRRLSDAGIPVPAFRPVNREQDLQAAVETFGYPVMLKARHGGYDGRGNFFIAEEADIEPALNAAPGAMLVEQVIEFDRELSVIGVRSEAGPATFPAGENIHEAEILRETIVPARTDEEILTLAQSVATDVLALMEGRGVFGIELFEADGEILVNEIAPRPHNSGHYSIEGAYTSQFAQHVRAVVGYPLGATQSRDPTVMANVLGDVTDPGPASLTGVEAVFETPGATLHWYGKREVRPLRKMGHVTMVPTGAESRADLLGTVRRLSEDLTFET
jgi:5-(carboxyamino)imidazole ribonucleotide synthase